MSYTDKHIIETYSMLFDGLSSLTKIELIESLTKSLKREKTLKGDNFFSCFFRTESPKRFKKSVSF